MKSVKQRQLAKRIQKRLASDRGGRYYWRGPNGECAEANELYGLDPTLFADIKELVDDVLRPSGQPAHHRFAQALAFAYLRHVNISWETAGLVVANEFGVASGTVKNAYSTYRKKADALARDCHDEVKKRLSAEATPYQVARLFKRQYDDGKLGYLKITFP